MKKILFLILLCLLASSLIGCGGYTYENGSWVYITYDEGRGKTVSPLNADYNTFKVLKNKDYAKDKNSVYHYSSVVEDAEPNTFEIINNDGYSKDANYVFIDGLKIIGANPQTFVYLNFPYSKDDKHIFCGTLPMFVKNVEDFKVTKRGLGKNTSDTEYFLESNKEYSFIDPQIYGCVVYCTDSSGETKDQKFQGFKQVK